MTALLRHIQDAIRAGGPLSVGAYMRLVLTERDDSYYRNRDPIGAGGGSIAELDAAVLKDGLVRADTLPLVFKALGCEALPRGARVRVRITGLDLLTLEELLARADVVSIHVPLIEATRNLFDAERPDLAQRWAAQLEADEARGEALHAGHHCLSVDHGHS